MRYRWELALVAMCAIWGWTFVVVRDAVAITPPFRFLALRFALAIVVLAAIGGARALDARLVRAGVVMGVALFAGYAFQTVGLQYTSASNAGFITGLWVVLTPLMGALLLRKLPSLGTAIGVVLATVGLVLLASPTGGFGKGEVIVFLCSVSFAAHILLTGRYSPEHPALQLTIVQLATVAALSTTWSVVAEPGGLPGSGTVWFAVVVTGVLASALAFVVQTRAQRETPPTRTAVILAAEPAFAGVAGYVLAGDRLGASGYAGAALIMSGILVAEILAPRDEAI